jgi:hypothetical protein
MMNISTYFSLPDSAFCSSARFPPASRFFATASPCHVPYAVDWAKQAQSIGRFLRQRFEVVVSVGGLKFTLRHFKLRWKPLADIADLAAALSPRIDDSIIRCCLPVVFLPLTFL